MMTRACLLFDMDGKKSAQEPANREQDGQLHKYMREATQLVADEFKVKDASPDGGIVFATDIMKQMVVLDASGWSGEGHERKWKALFHFIMPGYRVAGVEGRRQLGAIMTTQQKKKQLSLDFDTKIYGCNRHTLQAAYSGQAENGHCPLLCVNAKVYNHMFHRKK